VSREILPRKASIALIQLFCPGCQSQVFLECSCPPGHVANVGQHHPECSHSNLDASLVCPPDSGCCSENHDHAAAANACPGGHDDAPCPEPTGKCRVWRGAIADAFHPAFEPGSHPLFSGAEVPSCPGGHCHKDVPGCTVCRPLVITMLPGSAEITPVGTGA
jgi:hypothetical protein